MAHAHTPATRSTTQPKNRLIDIQIPNGCHAGVFWRALLYSEGFCALTLVFKSTSVHHWLEAMMAWNLSLLPTILCSLLSWCYLRKKCTHWPIIWQLLCAILLPILYITTLTHFNVLFELLNVSQAPFILLIPLAGLITTLAIHYFDLRERAFSPALTEARLQALQARIRPHFLFNSLNAVLASIRTNPQQAERTLEDLAELFRMQMRENTVFISLDDELTLCQQYISIETLRLGNRLSINWEIPKKLPSLQIPALLLQPLIENAIVHGIEPSQTPQPILIQIEQHHTHYLIITITNQKPPSDLENLASQSMGNGMALANIKERLALLYDFAAKLHIKTDDHTFSVELRIPI